MPQRFLIIQTAFIGDVVLATGLIEKLHHHFPEAEIDFLLRKGNEGLLSGHPLLRHVLIWDKKKEKFKNLLNLLVQIRRNKYDKVINIQRYAATGLLTALSGANEKIGFDKNPLRKLFTKVIPHDMQSSDSVSHEIERNNKLIEHFTDKQAAKPKLYPPDAAHARVKAYKRTPFITISPGSVWFTKAYPIDKWLAMIEKVSYDYMIYLLGGSGEVDLGNEIKSRTSNPFVVNLCGQLNFLESASLMSAAAMNYVNDSAPMHFASAMNAPVTAVYCSTVPAFGYGPLSDVSHIVEIQSRLYCRPCGLHGYQQCPEGHFKCARNIETAQLLVNLPTAPKFPYPERSEYGGKDSSDV